MDETQGGCTFAADLQKYDSIIESSQPTLTNVIDYENYCRICRAAMLGG